MTADGFPHLSSLTALEELKLSYVPPPAIATIWRLTTLTSLRALELLDCGIRGQPLLLFESLTNLTRVSRYCQCLVANQSPTPIAHQSWSCR